MGSEQQKAMIRCPGCGQSLEVSAEMVNAREAQVSPGWQEALALLKVEQAALFGLYQDIAERTETPLYKVLAQALDLALPEVRRQYQLCSFCGESLSG